MSIGKWQFIGTQPFPVFLQIRNKHEVHGCREGLVVWKIREGNSKQWIVGERVKFRNIELQVNKRNVGLSHTALSKITWKGKNPPDWGCSEMSKEQHRKHYRHTS
jgi:hypothetical protein